MAGKQYLDLDGLSLYDRLIKGYIKDNGGGSIVPITYSELKDLRDNSQLTPGQLYRMTDYETTTLQENTRSAGHLFDLILMATSESELNSHAYATTHEGYEHYFRYCNLSAWEILYDMDNNANKYKWADPVNGKGIIYYMKDEYGNECGYDFKNIQFRRWYINASAPFWTPPDYERGEYVTEYGGQENIGQKIKIDYWCHNENTGYIKLNSVHEFRWFIHRYLTQEELEMLEHEFGMSGVDSPPLIDNTKKYMWLFSNTFHNQGGYGGQNALLELRDEDEHWFYTFSWHENKQWSTTLDATTKEETFIGSQYKCPENNLVRNDLIVEYLLSEDGGRTVQWCALPNNILFVNNGNTINNRIINCYNCIIAQEASNINMSNSELVCAGGNFPQITINIQNCSTCVFPEAPNNLIMVTNSILSSQTGDVVACSAIFNKGTARVLDIRSSNSIYDLRGTLNNCKIRYSTYVALNYNPITKNSFEFSDGELIHVTRAYIGGPHNKFRFVSNLIMYFSNSQFIEIDGPAQYANGDSSSSINSCQNIKIGFGKNIKINSGCQNIEIGYASQYIYNKKNACSDLVFGQECKNIKLATGCRGNKFGNNVKYVTLNQYCTDNIIMDNCGEETNPIVFNNRCSWNIIENNCKDIEIGDDSNNNRIKSYSQTVNIFMDVFLAEIGHRATAVNISSSSKRIKVGDVCSNSTVGGEDIVVGNMCEFINCSGAHSVTIGNTCNNIRVNGDCIHVGDYCQKIEILGGSSELTIGDYCYALIISGLKNSVFEGNNHNIRFNNEAGGSTYNARVSVGLKGLTEQDRLLLNIGIINNKQELVYVMSGDKYLVYWYTGELNKSFKYKRTPTGSWING